MQAKFINEVNQFQRGLDPKSAMSIGRIGELEKKHHVTLTILSPNQILILGVKESAADMIQYALDLGANQLWYKKTKLRYHEPIIPTPNFAEAFVIITKVSNLEWTTFGGQHYEKIAKIIYKDITSELYGSYYGKPKIKTSASFYEKYAPCDDTFLGIINETIKNGTIL